MRGGGGICVTRTRHGASVRGYTRRRFRCRSLPPHWRHLRFTVQRRWSPKEDVQYDSTSFCDLSIPPRGVFCGAPARGVLARFRALIGPLDQDHFVRRERNGHGITIDLELVKRLALLRLPHELADAVERILVARAGDGPVALKALRLWCKEPFGRDEEIKIVVGRHCWRQPAVINKCGTQGKIVPVFQLPFGVLPSSSANSAADFGPVISILKMRPRVRALRPNTPLNVSSNSRNRISLGMKHIRRNFSSIQDTQ